MDDISNIINQHQHADLKEETKEETTGTSLSAEATESSALEVESTTSAATEQTIDAAEIRSVLHGLKDQIDGLLHKLDGTRISSSSKPITPRMDTTTTEVGGTVLEGVFNGEKMVGPDGKEYSVPPNYASKSKLIEGDIMKLTIRDDGSFLYKQIGPVVRKRIMGTLLFDPETQKWTVDVDGKQYKTLTASVTFYKGKQGDEAVILVPEDGDSAWGAVENIINK